MTIILGIDPGTNITGFGLIKISEDSKISYIHHEIIKTGLKNKYTTKLAMINEATSDIISKHNPAHVAIESVFFSVNAGTAIKLGQARGAAICACSRQSLEIYEYSPRRVKMVVTTDGGADKEQLQKKVKSILNIRRKLEIDASDALGVAICHGMTLNNDPDSLKVI
ncbi:MAG: crossover junction endodeoxyribonuclease RuvC [Pseudomonadota bacterium]|nr:crossover junction endodeoxyribonuclease RuvC [Pseudomonadota bacterium]|tara:strand:+ start:56 stop:556 length:501 start_codon:yes stop_codon:yes gene_type:complete